MTRSRIRLLFLCGSTGIGHLARSLELARHLRSKGLEIVFACGDGKWRRLARLYGFSAEKLYEPKMRNPSVFGIRAVSAGELSKAFESEVAALNRLSPVAAIADWRFTAAASAEACGVPCIQIWNANWGLFAGNESLMRRQLRTHYMKILEHWRSGFSTFFRRIGRPDKRCIKTIFHGQLNLVADDPAFRGRNNFVKDGCWLGPLVPWLPPRTMQTSLQADVAVAFGGHHLAGLTRKLMRTMRKAGLRYRVLPARLRHLRSGRAFSFFPTEMLNCKVVVTHGGIGSIYQAMLAGKPMVVIPQQLEHFDNGLCVEAAGLGVCLPIAEQAQPSVRRALETVFQPSFTIAAAQTALRFQRATPLDNAYDALMHFCKLQ